MIYIFTVYSESRVVFILKKTWKIRRESGSTPVAGSLLCKVTSLWPHVLNVKIFTNAKVLSLNLVGTPNQWISRLWMKQKEEIKSLVDPTGAVGTRTPPFQVPTFSCSFRQKNNNRNWGVAVPTSGKSWIRHCKWFRMSSVSEPPFRILKSANWCKIHLLRQNWPVYPATQIHDWVWSLHPPLLLKSTFG